MIISYDMIIWGIKKSEFVAKTQLLQIFSFSVIRANYAMYVGV